MQQTNPVRSCRCQSRIRSGPSLSSRNVLPVSGSRGSGLVLDISTLALKRRCHQLRSSLTFMKNDKLFHKEGVVHHRALTTWNPHRCLPVQPWDNRHLPQETFSHASMPPPDASTMNMIVPYGSIPPRRGGFKKVAEHWQRDEGPLQSSQGGSKDQHR